MWSISHLSPIFVLCNQHLKTTFHLFFFLLQPCPQFLKVKKTPKDSLIFCSFLLSELCCFSLSDILVLPNSAGVDSQNKYQEVCVIQGSWRRKLVENLAGIYWRLVSDGGLRLGGASGLVSRQTAQEVEDGNPGLATVSYCRPRTAVYLTQEGGT